MVPGLVVPDTRYIHMYVLVPGAIPYQQTRYFGVWYDMCGGNNTTCMCTYVLWGGFGGEEPQGSRGGGGKENAKLHINIISRWRCSFRS